MGAGITRPTIYQNDSEHVVADLESLIAGWMIDHNLAPRHWSRLLQARSLLTKANYDQWQAILVTSSLVTKDFLSDNEVDFSLAESLRAVHQEQQSSQQSSSQSKVPDQNEVVFRSLATDISMASYSFETPLHVAAREGNRWLVEWLLAQIQLAAALGGDAKTRSVASAAALCRRDKSGAAPLLVAASYGHLQLCDFMHRHISHISTLEKLDGGKDADNDGVGCLVVDLHRLQVARHSSSQPDTPPSVADMATANGLAKSPLTTSSDAANEAHASGGVQPGSSSSSSNGPSETRSSTTAHSAPPDVSDPHRPSVHPEAAAATTATATTTTTTTPVANEGTLPSPSDGTNAVVGGGEGKHARSAIADPVTGYLPMSTTLSYWADAQERYGYGGARQRKWLQQHGHPAVALLGSF